MDAGHGPQDALDSGGEPGLVGGALQDAGPHPRTGDAVLDVVEEELVQHVHTRGTERRPAVVEVVGELVVGVEAGGDHDVEVDLRGHLLDRLDVAPEADHGEVDDGVDAGRLELVQAFDGSWHLGGAVPPRGPVGGHLGRAHEDVLVHERGAEAGGVDRAAHRVDLPHVLSLGSRPRGGRPCYRTRHGDPRAPGVPDGAGQPARSGPARSTVMRSRTRRSCSMAARYSSQSGCSPEIWR